jgi:dipeptidase E
LGMPKLYLLGGENVTQRSAREINMQAFHDAAEAPAVLVFPWARPSFDNTYGKRRLVSDYFRGIGAATVDFVEYGEATGLEEKIRQSDLIYLTGGQASILLERAKKMHLEQPLRKFKGVIVGRSAGALAVCRQCVTTQRYSQKIGLVEGLGLAPIALKAHYIPEDTETLQRFSLSTPIYAVPKDSALTYQDGKLAAVGSVYLFNGGARHPFIKVTL